MVPYHVNIILFILISLLFCLLFGTLGFLRVAAYDNIMTAFPAVTSTGRLNLTRKIVGGVDEEETAILTPLTKGGMTTCLSGIGVSDNVVAGTVSSLINDGITTCLLIRLIAEDNFIDDCTAVMVGIII